MSDGSGYALRLSGSKIAVICLAIMVLSYTLARHEGIPSILILLAVVVLYIPILRRKPFPVVISMPSAEMRKQQN